MSTILIGSEDTYQSLVSFMPEDARKVLDTEIPRIRKQVSDDIDKFVTSIGIQMQAEFTKVAESVRKESEAPLASLDKIKESLASNTAKAEDLARAADNLRKLAQEYQDKWTNVGATIRTTAITAARAAGLPVPNFPIPGPKYEA